MMILLFVLFMSWFSSHAILPLSCNVIFCSRPCLCFISVIALSCIVLLVLYTPFRSCFDDIALCSLVLAPAASFSQPIPGVQFFAYSEILPSWACRKHTWHIIHIHVSSTGFLYIHCTYMYQYRYVRQGFRAAQTWYHTQIVMIECHAYLHDSYFLPVVKCSP